MKQNPNDIIDYMDPDTAKQIGISEYDYNLYCGKKLNSYPKSIETIKDVEIKTPLLSNSNNNKDDTYQISEFLLALRSRIPLTTFNKLSDEEKREFLKKYYSKMNERKQNSDLESKTRGSR